MMAVASARFRHDALHAYVVAALERLDVPRDDAMLAADALIAADLTGVDSHGVARFATHPGYVPGLRKGFVNPRPNDRIVEERAATALYDGDGGMGVVIGTRAMKVAIEKARGAGAGLVSVTNSRHFGIAAHYAMMALEHGMIGIAMTNAAPQVVQPGGATPMLGTNPIAVAAPAGDETPFVLDMATSVGAAGKAEIALRAGKSMPAGWVVDGAGQPTNDPAAVLGGGGALLPLGSFSEIGSHKGYGLAIAVDVLCGVLSGAGYSAALDPASWSTGHFFGAVDVRAFRDLPAFRGMMDEMIRALRAAPRIPGVERHYIHGEREVETERTRRRDGVPLHEQVIESLRALERELDITFPEPLS